MSLITNPPINKNNNNNSNSNNGNNGNSGDNSDESVLYHVYRLCLRIIEDNKI